MTKDEVKKLRMNSPESLQFLNNATKFYSLMMMYRCAIREIQTKLEVLDDEFSVENNRNPISFIKTLFILIVDSFSLNYWIKNHFITIQIFYMHIYCTDLMVFISIVIIPSLWQTVVTKVLIPLHT